MQLSIVVTSYDQRRKRDISDLLDSIQAQINDNFEVVYVTERSESLYEYVRETMQGRGIRGRVIHNRGNWGLSECRNIGIDHSEGEIVAFVDDDVVLDPFWGRAILNAFSRSLDGIVGATGPAYPLWADEKADWLPTELDWLIGCTRWFKSEVPVEVRNCWGMNMCFRREIFEKVGYFDASATEKSRYLSSGNKETEGVKQGKMAEDVEFSLRVREKTGKKLYYLPDMKVYNKVYSYRLSNRFIIARSSWIGYSRRNISKVAGKGALSMEDSLLASLIVNQLIKNQRRLGLASELKRMRVITLALFSLAYGYVFGPLA